MNSLSKQFYEQTKAIHGQIESHPFFLKFRDGKMKPESYVQYLSDLLLIYQTLERGMARSLNHSEIQALYFEKLCRAPYLKKDIESFLPIHKFPSDAAKAYAQHLETVTDSDPLLLIPHAYVRYLGDLSGGRMLQKMVNQQFPENDDAFYDFQDLLGPNFIGAKVVEFKNLWKKRLDELPFSPKIQEALIEEAKQAFVYAKHMLDAIL